MPLKGPILKIAAGAIALVCLLTGAYLTFFHSRGFVRTTAVIVDVERDFGGDGDTFTPTVEYTVDGVTYTGKLEESSASYRVGGTMPVLYDPKDPGVVHGGGGIGIYLMIAGGAALAVILLAAAREKQSRRAG